MGWAKCAPPPPQLPPAFIQSKDQALRRCRLTSPRPPLPHLDRTGLLLHGQSDKERAERDAERKEAEELAAKWRTVAESVSTLAQGLLANCEEGEEGVAPWLKRRFTELGIK